MRLLVLAALLLLPCSALAASQQEWLAFFEKFTAGYAKLSANNAAQFVEDFYGKTATVSQSMQNQTAKIIPMRQPQWKTEILKSGYKEDGKLAPVSRTLHLREYSISEDGSSAIAEFASIITWQNISTTPEITLGQPMLSESICNMVFESLSGQLKTVRQECLHGPIQTR